VVLTATVVIVVVVIVKAVAREGQVVEDGMEEWFTVVTASIIGTMILAMLIIPVDMISATRKMAPLQTKASTSSDAIPWVLG
jgi:hypothetical protein